MNRAKKIMTTIFDDIDVNTILLMHMDGVDDGVVFTDEVEKTINVLYPVVTKTAEKKFGAASAYFASPKGALYVEHNDFKFANNNFTIEGWFYPTSFTSQCVLFDLLKVGGTYTRNNSFAVLNLAGGKVQVYTKNTYLTVTTNPLTVNQWNHIAIVRSANTIQIFINGNLESTSAFTTDVQEGALMIGLASDNYTQPFFGYVDEVRVCKDVALWTSNFTPSGPYTR